MGVAIPLCDPAPTPWVPHPECPLTSVSSPTRCKFSKPAARSWMQGGLSVSDLLLSDPSLASPSQHPHPHLHTTSLSPKTPGGSQVRGILMSCPFSPTAVPLPVWRTGWGE